MTNYERPKTPPDTPPVIDPQVRAKTASELDGGGQTEGEVLGDRSERSKVNKEMSEKLTKRGQMDGAGEQRLDSMHAETTLPPD